MIERHSKFPKVERPKNAKKPSSRKTIMSDFSDWDGPTYYSFKNLNADEEAWVDWQERVDKTRNILYNIFFIGTMVCTTFSVLAFALDYWVAGAIWIVLAFVSSCLMFAYYG